jgi:Glycosyltransferase family 87
MNQRTLRNAAYGLLAATLAIHAFLFWKERSLIARGYPDFTIFYSAGLMVRQGLGHHLYDGNLQYQVQRSFAPQVEIRQAALPYNHPPFEALIFAPLTFLPYWTAYLTWNLLNLGMLALVSRLLRPHIAILQKKPLVVWVVGLLASFPVVAALLQGQDVILLLLLQTLAFVALKRHSDFLAGSWLGLGSFRIQFVLPLMLILWLGWKRPKVLLGFVAACLFVGAISLAIVGREQAVHYPVSVLHMERVVENADMVPSMPNLRGLFEGWKVQGKLATVLHVLSLVFSVVLLAWVIVTSRKELDEPGFEKPGFDEPTGLHFAMAAITSVLVGYHAFSHDLVLLIIPLFIVLNVMFAGEFLLRRDLLLLLPAGLLLLTPLYMLLWLYLIHLNLLALVLLLWLAGIHHRIKANSNLHRRFVTRLT